MKKLIILLCLAALTSASLAQEPKISIPRGIPQLNLDADWTEKHQPNDLIHKTRPPRGGTFEVIAKLDFTDTKPLPLTVALDAECKLAPFKATLNGKPMDDPLEDIKIDKPDRKYEIRWSFAIPWEVRGGASEYEFTVSTRSPHRHSNIQYAPLKKSITIEPALSCYDTTYTDRLKMLAASDYCKLETTGKSLLGRDLYLLRVTDFSVPAKGKKQFVMIGAYHGNEPTGTESLLDFVYELVNDPANAHYLKKVALYIVPCMSPDSRETGTWRHVDGMNMNLAFDADKLPPEAVHTAAALKKYKAEFTQPISVATHQKRQDFMFLSMIYKTKGDASHRLARDICVQVSNSLDQRVPLYSKAGDPSKYRSIIGYMFAELGIPNFVLENGEQDTYNLGKAMLTMRRELLTYYAVLDFLCGKESPKPKVRATKKVTFPAERNYSVYKTASPPVLDGKLDDACWRNAAVITKLTTASKRRAKPITNVTFRLAYDDKFLYVAMSANDLKASPFTGRDPADGTADDPEAAIWNTDGMDVMFDTNLNQWSYYQFIANASGGFADNYYPLPELSDFTTFDITGYKFVGSVKGGAIEVAIPFAAFNDHPQKNDPPVPSPPPAGTVWGANLSRNEHSKKPAATWAKLGIDAHAPWKFNAITFKGEKHGSK